MAGVAINQAIEVGEPPGPAEDRYRAEFTGWFGQGGWFEQSHSPRQVSYIRDHFHTWQILVAILLFPIGLLALLAEKEHYNVTAAFSELGKDSTTIRLTGVIPQKVAGQWLQRLDAFDPAVEAEPAADE